jgi:hypothetical protein
VILVPTALRFIYHSADKQEADLPRGRALLKRGEFWYDYYRQTSFFPAIFPMLQALRKAVPWDRRASDHQTAAEYSKHVD